jgi:cytochrome c-type biogenesis protein
VLLAAPVAAVAGLVSFLSPCVLPLVPGYLSYVTGMSGADLATERRRRGLVLTGALLFVLGFSVVFTVEGAAFGSLGTLLKEHERGLEVVLGSITIVLGLAFAGVFARVPLAQREWRLTMRPGVGLAAAPLLGVLFGVGWTPCLGPTLSAVLGMSSVSATAGRGALLSLAYCLGLGIPFLLVALAFRRSIGVLAAVRRHSQAVMLAGGVLLVVVGVLEVTGAWTTLSHSIQAHLGNGAQV